MSLQSLPPGQGPDFAQFGLEEIAYVRPIVVNGRHVHIIHAADGTFLTLAMDRELAFLTIRQNELSPHSVH